MFSVLAHRAAHDADLAAEPHRDVDRLLHAGGRRGERRDRGSGPVPCGTIWRNASPTIRSDGVKPDARHWSSHRGSCPPRGSRSRPAGRLRSGARRPARGRARSRPRRRSRPAAISSRSQPASGIECATRTNSSGTAPTPMGSSSGSTSSSSAAEAAVLVELRLHEAQRQPVAQISGRHLAHQVGQRADVILVGRHRAPP